ncbi:MAG: hypothetical protein Q9193_004226 [Seirophora villosa]
MGTNSRVRTRFSLRRSELTEFEIGRYSRHKRVGGPDSRKHLFLAEDVPAAIRYALGGEHTYDFIDGSVPADMAPGMLGLACASSSPLKKLRAEHVAYLHPRHSTGMESFASSAAEGFLQYADGSDPASCLRALKDLESYVDEEGPFDGVMAFSQGAGLAASLLIYRMQKKPRQARSSPPFRCAVFFSGGVPEDPSDVEAAARADAEQREMTFGEEKLVPRRLMSVEQDGEIIEIPTAHIWGRADDLYPTFGPVLSQMCKIGQREIFVHDGGHEIVGAKDQIALQKAVRVINRTIARMDTVQ